MFLENLSNPETLATHITAITGFFGYVFYKEVLPRLLSRERVRASHTNGNAGSRSVEYWQQQFATIVTASMSSGIVPVLQQQTEILREIRDMQRDTNDNIIRLMERSR